MEEIIAVYILFWLYWHDQHDRYSTEPIDLSSAPPSLSLCSQAGNEVRVFVVCLLPNSLGQIMGFRSDCVAAIISSHSGLYCQLNAGSVVVNYVFCVCKRKYFLYAYSYECLYLLLGVRKVLQ